MRTVQALLPPTPDALEDLLDLFDDESADSASSAARTSKKRRRELLRQLVSEAADVDGEFSLDFDLRKASGLWSRALDRCAMRSTAHTFCQDVPAVTAYLVKSLSNLRGGIRFCVLRFCLQPHAWCHRRSKVGAVACSKHPPLPRVRRADPTPARVQSHVVYCVLHCLLLGKFRLVGGATCGTPVADRGPGSRTPQH
jgi:hypothetical protein